VELCKFFWYVFLEIFKRTFRTSKLSPVSFFTLCSSADDINTHQEKYEKDFLEISINEITKRYREVLYSLWFRINKFIPEKVLKYSRFNLPLLIFKAMFILSSFSKFRAFSEDFFVNRSAIENSAILSLWKKEKLARRSFVLVIWNQIYIWRASSCRLPHCSRGLRAEFEASGRGSQSLGGIG